MAGSSLVRVARSVNLILLSGTLWGGDFFLRLRFDCAGATASVDESMKQSIAMLLDVVVGAPDTNRTCDPILRRNVLYPLSYGGGVTQILSRRGSIAANRNQQPL